MAITVTPELLALQGKAPTSPIEPAKPIDPETAEQAKVLAGEEKAGTVSRVLQGILAADPYKVMGAHPKDLLTDLTGSETLGNAVGGTYDTLKGFSPGAILGSMGRGLGLVGDATVRTKEETSKKLTAPEYEARIARLKTRLSEAAGKPVSVQITDTGGRDGLDLDKARSDLMKVYQERQLKQLTPEEAADPGVQRKIKADGALWALDTAKSAMQGERLPYTMIGEDNWTDSIMKLPYFTRHWAAHFLPKSYVHEDGTISEQGIGLRGGSAVLDYIGNVLSLSDIVSSVISDKAKGTGDFKAPWSREAIEEIRSGETLWDATPDVYDRAGKGSSGVAAAGGWLALSLAVEYLDPYGLAAKGTKMAAKAGTDALKFAKLALRGEKIADAFEVAKPKTFTDLKKLLKNDVAMQFLLSRKIAERIGNIPELKTYAELTGKDLEALLETSYRGLQAGIPELEKGLKAALISIGPQTSGLRDVAGYGVPSAVTQSYLTSRMNSSFIDPEHPFQGLAPISQELKEQGALASALVHRTGRAVTEGIYRNMPPVIQGQMETKMDVFKKGNNPGAQLYHNPNDLLDTNKVLPHRRTKFDESVRALGMKSLPEMHTTQMQWIKQAEDARINVAQQELFKRTMTAIEDKKPDDVARNVTAWLKLNPDGRVLKQQIAKAIVNSNLTPMERQARKLKAYKQIDSYMRYKEMAD